MTPSTGKRRARRLTVVAPLAALTVASTALLASTSGTLAAWTDDEYVSTGAGVMVAGDCSTTTLFKTESTARQVSGSLGGQDLDTLADVEGIQVGNTSGTVTVAPSTATRIDSVTYTTALEAGALGSPLLSAKVGLNQAAGNAGAYTQWARARASGQAAGAAGLVSDQSGAIHATGTADGSTSTPTTASINLASFIPTSQAAMTLDVGAVASSSEMDACVLNNGWPSLNPAPLVARDYGIAALGLNLSAPAIGPMTTSVSRTLNAIPENLTALASPTGSLTTSINLGVAGLIPAGALSLGGVSTEITFGAPDLTAARQLLGRTITDGVVTIDLATARIHFDLARLTYGPAGLNDRPANTQVLLNAAAVQDLTKRISALLQKWADDMTAEIDKAVAATSLTIESRVLLRTSVRLGLVDIDVDAAEVTLGYDTTAGALLSESPPAPTPSTKVLGTPDLGLLNSVTDALVGGTGGVVAGALDTALTVTGGLLPTAEAAVRSAVVPVTKEAETALAPLADTLTLTVNVQPDQPGAPAGNAAAGSAAEGEYKVSALRVGAVGSTAELYLATASAGPVVFRPAAG
ncbi:choice-of-anchor G family protein [Arthrobacter sp. NPDC093125]|uniref:choice-of-anchor G family protein n=1 Tax=Arthrobacter sp. NPDC093125 TaxID=3363944 RepID=UPI0038115D57